MKSTSSESYQEVQSSGREASQIESIFKIISDRGMLSRREIAQLSGFELSAVCGRVNRLIKQRRIREYGTKQCGVTKKTVGVLSVWPTDSETHQQDLFKCQ